MDNIIVKDTFEVFLKDNQTPTNVYFLGINSQAVWTKKLNTTILKGGIGNLPKGLIQDSNEQDFQVDPLLWSDSLMALVSGSTTASGTATVKVSEKLQVASGAVTVLGTPAGTTADVFDANNKHYAGTIATKVVTIVTPPTDGTWITVVYDSSVTGDITTLSADKFPKAFTLFAHTIAYNPGTQAIVADIYFVFYQATPDGNGTATYKAGSEATFPIKFLLTVPVNSNDFGQYITVPRV